MAQVERVGHCNQQTTVDDTGRWLEQAESNQTPTCKQHYANHRIIISSMRNRLVLTQSQSQLITYTYYVKEFDPNQSLSAEI